MKELCTRTTSAELRISANSSSNGCNLMSCCALVVYFALVIFVFLARCAPPFSAMQSARLAGKGKFEVTPFFSTVSFSAEGETEHVQNEFGLQGAYGLGDRIDVQLRYEFISVEVEDPYAGDLSASANVIGLGPKIGIYRDIFAFCLPIGFAFGGDIDDVSETWQIHPTLVITLPIGKSFELSPSSKVLIPLSGDGDVLLAFNLGSGISANLRKWAIRPEIGFLINPGEEGHFTHFSVGITIYP